MSLHLSNNFLTTRLEDKITPRRALAVGDHSNSLIDFASNDYLGLSRSQFSDSDILSFTQLELGSTGSRLLTGQHPECQILEELIARELGAEAALFFPSGYQANLSLIQSLVTQHDSIFLDELCHSSIKDGMKLSQGSGYFFRHNDSEHLRTRLKRIRNNSKVKEIFVVTESIFSMDGDIPPLADYESICNEASAHLILDEAHSFGVLGPTGLGFGTTHKTLARVYPFAKALGVQGAAIVGCKSLKDNLINFARGFIYSSGPSPWLIKLVRLQFQNWINSRSALTQSLQNNLELFETLNQQLGLNFKGNPLSAIRCLLFDSDKQLIDIKNKLLLQDLHTLTIFPPTVREARLRVCVHSFNQKNEIQALFAGLSS